ATSTSVTLTARRRAARSYAKYTRSSETASRPSGTATSRPSLPHATSTGASPIRRATNFQPRDTEMKWLRPVAMLRRHGRPAGSGAAARAGGSASELDERDHQAERRDLPADRADPRQAGGVGRQISDPAAEVELGPEGAPGVGLAGDMQGEHDGREQREGLGEVALGAFEAAGDARRLKALVARADGVGVAHLGLEGHARRAEVYEREDHG